VGSRHAGYGIVFFGDSMVPAKRTPEDSEKLNKLERLLESMGILQTEKAEFECSAPLLCLAYPVEPLEMMRRPHRRIGNEIRNMSSRALWMN